MEKLKVKQIKGIGSWREGAAVLSMEVVRRVCDHFPEADKPLCKCLTLPWLLSAPPSHMPRLLFSL